MVYSLLLDDAPVMTSRHEARERIDKILARPLDPIKAAQHDERQRLAEFEAEAIAAAGNEPDFWADKTYGAES